MRGMRQRLPVDVLVLLPFILAGAVLYSSVGHGGATVYLAILALAGYTLAPLTTTVLVLNVVAAGIAFLAFRQAGHLRPRLLLAFLVTSVPMAYLGGLHALPLRAYELLLGGALLLAALRFLLLPNPRAAPVPREGAWLYVGAPILGAALGFLAGATGIGGGIFLSPVLLALGWANVKESASIASAFIVLNSVAGLAAKLPRTPLDVGLLLPLVLAVAAGATVGALAGARVVKPRTLQLALGLVLLVAAAKTLVG